MRRYLIVMLICISLMATDVEHFFMYLLTVYISFDNCWDPLHISLLGWLFSFWVVWVADIFWMLILCCLHSLKILSPVLLVSFAWLNLLTLTLIKSYLSSFVFSYCALGVLAKNSSTTPVSWSVSPRNFIVSCIKLKPLTNLEFIPASHHIQQSFFKKCVFRASAVV